jgi:hypothetical protein
MRQVARLVATRIVVALADPRIESVGKLERPT